MQYKKHRPPTRLYLSMADIVESHKALTTSAKNKLPVPNPDDDDDVVMLDGFLPIEIVGALGASAADFFWGCNERSEGEQPFYAIALTGQFIKVLVEHILISRSETADETEDND